MPAQVKKKTAFFCQNCGYESAKWMGQCPSCHEWNTFVEEPKAPALSPGLGSKSSVRETEPGRCALQRYPWKAMNGS